MQATVTEVVPTVGFQVEEFAKNNLNFTVFDMSGQVGWIHHGILLKFCCQDRYRSLWENYYRDVEVLV